MNVSLPCLLSVCVPCKFITTPHTPQPAQKNEVRSLLQRVAARVGAIKWQKLGRGVGSRASVWCGGGGGGTSEQRAGEESPEVLLLPRPQNRGRSTDPPSPPDAVSRCIQVTWGKMKERSFRLHSFRDRLLLASENSATPGRKGLLLSTRKKTSCFFCR